MYKIISLNSCQNLSKPHALWGSSMEIKPETIDGVICIVHGRKSGLSRKSSKVTPDELRVGLEENL